MNIWQQYGLEYHGVTPDMAMDLRHVNTLHDCITAVKPGVAVEVGSWKGHSTVAFLEAMKKLPDMHLHVVELYPKPELLEILKPFGDRVTLHTKPTWEISDDEMRCVDFIFIDGDHGLAAFADVCFALLYSPTAIAMHDTRTFTNLMMKECFGSEKAHEWINEIPTVPIYYLANPQSRERA